MARRASQPAKTKVSVPVQPALPPLTPTEEHTWAMFAHLSVLLNLLTGILGPAVALVIFLVYRDRSRYVAFQSLQATLFQVVWWIGGGLIVGGFWVLTGLSSAVLVGLICIPFACVLSLLPLYPLIHGTIAAIRCSRGDEFEYFWIGAWTHSILGTA